MLNWIGKILRKKGDIMQLVRRNVFLVLLLLAVMVMVPMVSAQGKNISINITSPQEGEVYHVGDAIPRYIPISVLGVIDAPYGIQNITLSNGNSATSCGFTPGNHTDIRCDMQLDLSVDQITITVLDKQGNSASIVRNHSLEIQQLEPLKTRNIFISGKVTDNRGRAITGVEVVSESVSTPPEWEYYKKRSITDENGSYKIEDIFIGEENERNISVTKEGYIPIKKKIIIVSGNLTSEQNFILIPQKTSLSGFGFLLGICSILISLSIITVRKS
jgi:hypothetical protein